MIIFVQDIENAHARRLIADLHDSGFTVEHDSDSGDVELLLLTPATIAQYQAESSSEKPVIPVILVACDVPAAFSGQEIDLASSYLSGYQQLLERLYEMALAQKRNPYPGTRAYSETYAPYFFGRQAFLHRLQQHLAADGNLIALVGASASGKTSLIEAGLVPALRQEGGWLPLRIVMQDRPLHQLATRLQAMGDKRQGLTSRMEADAGALMQVLNEFIPNDTRLLLVLDGFESAFIRMSLSDRVHFLDALYRVIQNNKHNIFVVLALRPETYERLMEYPEWAALLPSNRLLVPALSTGEIGEIVEQPAQVAGLTIEPNLTQHIVADTARSNPKGLLLRLSFALAALWESQEFSVSRFEALGGVSNALNLHAESLFRNLSPMQQQIARHVLIWLAQVNQGNEVMSRTLPRDQFNFSWAEASEVNITLAILTRAQILNSFVEPTSSEQHIALSHEALLSEWKRYANWIEEEAQNLPYASHLEALASDWAAHDYAENFLLRGRELTRAALWAENPDHLYSPLLLEYVSASKQSQQTEEKKQQRQNRLRRGAMLGLAASWLLFAAVIVAGAGFATQLLQQRDQFSASQADSATQYAEAALQSSNIAAERDQFATRQAESANVAATYAAQIDTAATSQAAAESTLARLRPTANALADALSENATIEAEMEAAATNQAEAQATTLALESQFRAYIASNLAEDAATFLNSDPTLALRLAAEAAAIAFSNASDDLRDLAREALTDTLQGYASRQIGEDTAQSWLIGEHHVLINPNGGDDAELWQLDPPELIASLDGIVEQTIPVSNGQLFVVDYVGESPDEIWHSELGEAVQQLSGELAPPLSDEVEVPNLVQLVNGAYFVLRYDNQLPSELWETATAQEIATLDGDFDELVELADGFFFVSYSDSDINGGVWQASTGEMVQAADNVLAEFYDNDIFVLRRDQQFDEVWRTNPFARVTDVIGRIISVFDMRGHPYFVVRYAGDQPAQIWSSEPPFEVVHTFRSAIGISLPFLDDQFFLVRYNDESPSELWRIDPLEVVNVLNGSVNNLGLDLVAGGQVVLLDYSDNTVSELWSPESAARILPLNGNLEAAFPILGDVYFVIQYEGNQPAEVWAAINPGLVATLGDHQEKVTDIIPLKGGSFLAVLYEESPGEIWQVDGDGVRLLRTLPDVTSQAIPIQGGDYLVLDFLNEPAQLWQLVPLAPIIDFESHVQDLSYDPESGRLTYASEDNQVYSYDMEIIVMFNTDERILSDADLLMQVCSVLAEVDSIPNEQLASALGGLPPSACREEAPVE